MDSAVEAAHYTCRLQVAEGRLLQVGRPCEG